MPRLFIAIELPQVVKDVLAQLPPRGEGVRPVTPAQMHLTLHFIGETPEDDAAVMAEALRAVRCARFTLRFDAPGCFPPRGDPRILWMGLAREPALVRLHADIGDVLRDLGVALEDRPFHPHLTLARCKARPPRGVMERFLAQSNFAVPAVPVDRFVLYASELNRGGAIHRERAGYPLL